MPNDHAGIRLVQLTQPEPNGWARPREAPVEYVNVPLQGEEVLACVQTGLHLIRDGDRPLAMLAPLPDRACRARLIALYSRGLEVRLDNTERLLDQTEGVGAAFIRELLRKAALFAADEGPELVVEDRHLSEALHELVVEGGELTCRLLGAASPAQAQRPRDAC